MSSDTTINPIFPVSPNIKNRFHFIVADEKNGNDNSDNVNSVNNISNSSSSVSNTTELKSNNFIYSDNRRSITSSTSIESNVVTTNYTDISSSMKFKSTVDKSPKNDRSTRNTILVDKSEKWKWAIRDIININKNNIINSKYIPKKWKEVKNLLDIPIEEPLGFSSLMKTLTLKDNSNETNWFNSYRKVTGRNNRGSISINPVASPLNRGKRYSLLMSAEFSGKYSFMSPKNKKLPHTRSGSYSLFSLSQNGNTTPSGANSLFAALQNASQISKRENMKFNNALVKTIKKWWKFLGKFTNASGVTCVLKEEYFQVLCLMFSCLLDNIPKDKVLEQAREEVESEIKENEGLTWTSLHRILYELADHWTVSCDVDEYYYFIYILFLNRLLDDITVITDVIVDGESVRRLKSIQEYLDFKAVNEPIRIENRKRMTLKTGGLEKLVIDEEIGEEEINNLSDTVLESTNSTIKSINKETNGPKDYASMTDEEKRELLDSIANPGPSTVVSFVTLQRKPSNISTPVTSRSMNFKTSLLGEVLDEISDFDLEEEIQQGIFSGRVCEVRKSGEYEDSLKMIDEDFNEVNKLSDEQLSQKEIDKRRLDYLRCILKKNGTDRKSVNFGVTSIGGENWEKDMEEAYNYYSQKYYNNDYVDLKSSRSAGKTTISRSLASRNTHSFPIKTSEEVIASQYINYHNLASSIDIYSWKPLSLVEGNVTPENLQINQSIHTSFDNSQANQSLDTNPSTEERNLFPSLNNSIDAMFINGDSYFSPNNLLIDPNFEDNANFNAVTVNKTNDKFTNPYTKVKRGLSNKNKLKLPFIPTLDVTLCNKNSTNTSKSVNENIYSSNNAQIHDPFELANIVAKERALNENQQHSPLQSVSKFKFSNEIPPISESLFQSLSSSRNEIRPHPPFSSARPRSILDSFLESHGLNLPPQDRPNSRISESRLKRIRPTEANKNIQRLASQIGQFELNKSVQKFEHLSSRSTRTPLTSRPYTSKDEYQVSSGIKVRPLPSITSTSRDSYRRDSCTIPILGTPEAFQSNIAFGHSITVTPRSRPAIDNTKKDLTPRLTVSITYKKVVKPSR